MVHNPQFDAMQTSITRKPADLYLNTIQSKRKEIIFIDQKVAYYQLLIAGINSGIEVILLDHTRDGVLQITDVLQQRIDISTVHIVSHGNVACLALGNSMLSNETLAAYQTTISSWRSAFNCDTDILIYGCQVGSGAIGFDFVRKLAALTSANIAASHNLTGQLDKNADWNLKVRIGHIRSSIAFNDKTTSTYQGTLATQVEDFNTDPGFAGGFASSFILNGFTYTFTADGDGGDFTWESNLGVGNTGAIKPDSGAGVTPDNTETTERYTIAKSDGTAFVFNSIDLWSGSQTVTVTGILSNSTVGTTTLIADNSSFQSASFGSATVVDVIRITSVNFDIATSDVFDNFSYDLTIPNATPTISINNTNLSYTENLSATQIDSAATLSDADGDTDWNGGTLTIQISANNETADRLTIVDNAVGTINTNSTDLLNGSTVIGTLSALEGTVHNDTALTITFNANATNALVQQVIQSIHYDNISNDPGASNRTITFTATDKHGATASDTRTIALTHVNDEPILSATGSTSTFIQGGPAVDLFSGITASTIESGQTLEQLILTVTNVTDGNGANEFVGIDGQNIALSNGNTGTTTASSIDYSVALSGSTATVTITRPDMSATAIQTLIDGFTYSNDSASPTANNHAITLASLKDSGGTANSGDDTNATLNITSLITVQPNAQISSSTYDYNTNQLIVTGTNFIAQTGATNDVDVSLLIITGEGGSTYTLAESSDVEIESATQFTINLIGADINNLEALLNKNGTSSASGTTYNLAAADNWMPGSPAGADISDAASGITINNYAPPTITSANFDASTNILAVTGTNLVSNSGTANDVAVSKLTITGEGGSYTLTSSNVEVTSATAFSITLNAADQLVVHGLLNKNGISSSSAIPYNVAADDDWMTGSPAENEISDTTDNTITVSNIPNPTITAATYDAETGVLVVTGTNLFNKPGADNDIDVSRLTFTGGSANATYTITNTPDVDISSSTSFSVTLTGIDRTNVDVLLDQMGTTSSDGSTYNLAAADNWLAGADPAIDISDTTSTVNVSISPKIISATYDADTGILVVTGTNIQSNSSGSDIDVSSLTFTGEGELTYTLTDSADVERDSTTQFTVILSATDKAAINQIINKNGTSSNDGIIYNLATADDWNTNVATGDISDITDNSITVSKVSPPEISSAIYDAISGVLVVTGTNFLQASGAANDIDASRLTFTGEGGATYTLTDTPDIEITSGAAFTVALSAADKAAINQIINKNGTSSTSGTVYNLAAEEDWATGADAAVNVADMVSNEITVSNVAVPSISSATYDGSTGKLLVTGMNFFKASGAANDIDASRFAFTGEGGAIYTLTDTPDIEITSDTAFTVTLSAADKTAVNQIINKNGTSSADGTIYNLAAEEDWAVGTDTTVIVADMANSISATIPITSSGGIGDNGNTTITTLGTVDGVDISTITEINGSTTLITAIVKNSRIEDPTTIYREHADIPILLNNAETPILTISIPSGVGLIVNGQPDALDKQYALNELAQRIEQKTDANNNERQEMTAHSQNFISLLSANDIVSVQTITPIVDNAQTPSLPIIITGLNSTADGKQALVIDATHLPAGTTIQLDKVAFAAITGEVRVTGSAGENFITSNSQNQFIVLDRDNDILIGGGGDDTVGSLAGNDHISGASGNDIVYGGAGNDTLSGGTGTDKLNGGSGFDNAQQEGQRADYHIETDHNNIILTHKNGDIDTLTDVELIHFTTGPALAIAHTNIEAAAHHLAKSWLERDLTVTEGHAIQNWAGADLNDLIQAFFDLPETMHLHDKTADELLAGVKDNPDIIQLNSEREFIGSSGDDQGYSSLGLALNIDGAAGHDILQISGSRSDIHLELVDDRLELTHLNDGAMLGLKNAEMIAFDNNENIILAHNEVAGILGRLFQAFFNRDATMVEWQLGNKALANDTNPEIILNWFQEKANLNDFSDTAYVQTLYHNTLERQVTPEELENHLTQLTNEQITREWLAVDIASSDEAVIAVGSVIVVEGWI